MHVLLWYFPMGNILSEVPSKSEVTGPVQSYGTKFLALSVKRR